MTFNEDEVGSITAWMEEASIEELEYVLSKGRDILQELRHEKE